MAGKEKEFLEQFRKLESETSQDALLFQAEALVQAQDALKFECGPVGLNKARPQSGVMQVRAFSWKQGPVPPAGVCPRHWVPVPYCE